MMTVILIDHSGLGGDGFRHKLASACDRVVIHDASADVADIPENGADIVVMVVAVSTKEAVAMLSTCRGSLQENIINPILVLPESAIVDAFVAGRIGFAGVVSLAAGAAGIREIIRTVLDDSGKKGSVNKGLIGESAAIHDVLTLVDKIADTDTTVLVCGESGTGKELIARALHEKSGRRGPFIPVNCGAIPAELLESELFGHEKGAFTNAVRTRLGRFELADHGTIFLDEIAEMSPVLQVKILRVLQEKTFERVGGTRTVSSDFRVIAATNRNLEDEVTAGRFREDLFYRLNVIAIEAPPLRERPEDICVLAKYFITRFNKSKKRNVKGLSPDALARMLSYPWPGNVRELENVIERMVILASGRTLGLADLPEKIAAGVNQAVPAAMAIPEEGMSLAAAVSNFEQDLILKALERTGWVKNRAAVLLKLNRTTLLEKMKRYGMTPALSSDKDG